MDHRQTVPDVPGQAVVAAKPEKIMIEIIVSGYKTFKLEHLVLDYNGTMACDGDLLPGVKAGLKRLYNRLNLHVLTADTFGNVEKQLSGIEAAVVILGPDDQVHTKGDYVRRLGPEKTVCIGNGANDRLMLKEAALGIGVIQPEGAWTEALLAADIICTDIGAAITLLTNPKRLVATARI